MIEQTQRRLAAIVSADVVGYSRLMGVDETGTLAALRAHRAEMIDAKIAEHGGRIVKTMGDGLLLEFPSVVNATACAVQMQESMALRNAEIAEDQRIVFRIGVNLGDIIIEGDDILGDGVNIAARIEALAEPGGVAIAGRVYEDVRDRLDVTFTDTGEQSLKNITRPVRVWQWSASEAPAPAAPPAQEPLSLTLPDKPSIAVLPFENRSGDPEQEFFADGMAEDIITALSQFDWLLVIARSSTFSFKGRSVSSAEVSEALGVRYVLGGSVRKAGNRVRITAELVDTSTSSPIWSNRYDRELEDIFAVQDEITEAIVGSVAPEIDEAERRLAQRHPPESLDVWARYQRALGASFTSTNDSLKSAIVLLDQINELAPTYAPAFAMAANIRLRSVMHYGGDRDEASQQAEAKIRMAMALEPLNPLCLMMLGRVYSFQDRHELGIVKTKEAVALNPNFAAAVFYLGFSLYRAGRFEEAIIHLDRAIRLSPRDIMSSAFFAIRGISSFCLGRYEEAAEWTLRSCHAPNPRPRIGLWATAALQKSGRSQEARATLSDHLRKIPSDTIETFHAFLQQNHPQLAASTDSTLDALREVGLPE